MRRYHVQVAKPMLGALWHDCNNAIYSAKAVMACSLIPEILNFFRKSSIPVGTEVMK